MDPRWMLTGVLCLAIVTGPRDPAPPVEFHRAPDCADGARFRISVRRDGYPVPRAVVSWLPPHFSVSQSFRADANGHATSRCHRGLLPLHPCMATRPFHPLDTRRARERRFWAYELDRAKSHGMQCWVRISEHDLVAKAYTRVVLRRGYETRVTVELP
jgi:hypothetical protein